MWSVTKEFQKERQSVVSSIMKEQLLSRFHSLGGNSVVLELTILSVGWWLWTIMVTPTAIISVITMMMIIVIIDNFNFWVLLGILFIELLQKYCNFFVIAPLDREGVVNIFK